MSKVLGLRGGFFGVGVGDLFLFFWLQPLQKGRCLSKM